MTRPDALLLVPLLVLISACADAGMVTDVGEPTSENLVLRSDTVEITSLGDTLTPDEADIEYLGRPARVGEIRYEVVEEERWLDERAVLEASALEEGLLAATGPGTVRARVLATSLDVPEELTVTVEPTRPVATSARKVRVGGGGVQSTLRGYWPEVEPIEVSAGTARGETTVHDSANLYVRFPTEAFDGSNGGCSGSGLLPIRFLGGDVFGTVRIPSPTSRPGAVHLEPGEHVKGQIEAEGTSGEDACLKLAPVPGARYVLAYGDGSRAARATDGFEGDASGRLELTVADRSQPGDSRAAVSALATPTTNTSLSFSPGHLTTNHSTRAEASDPCREGWLHECPAWSVGDTVWLPFEKTAVVEFVEEGYLAVARTTGADEEVGVPEDLLGEAIRRVARRSLPLLKGVYETRHPHTSDRSGQLLVLVTADDIGSQGRADREYGLRSTGPRSVIKLNGTSSWDDMGEVFYVLSHELVHAFNIEYMFEAGPLVEGSGSAPYGLPTRWAEEGTADFLAYEALRQELGLAVGANWDGWRNPPLPGEGDGLARALSFEPRAGRGELPAGFSDASLYLRHLMTVRMEAGEDAREARRQVVRGALEGWHGFDDIEARHRGLARRMRNVLGSDWSPASSLARWAASHALDDRDAPVGLEVPLYKRAASVSQASCSSSGDSFCGWKAEATVEALSGERLRIERPTGSAGFVLLDDGGWGGTYRLKLENGEGSIAWRLIRLPQDEDAN